LERMGGGGAHITGVQWGGGRGPGKELKRGGQGRPSYYYPESCWEKSALFERTEKEDFQATETKQNSFRQKTRRELQSRANLPERKKGLKPPEGGTSNFTTTMLRRGH